LVPVAVFPPKQPGRPPPEPIIEYFFTTLFIYWLSAEMTPRFAASRTESACLRSSATVRNHLSNAIAKVGGRNRIDAIRIARDAGWL
jgi:hypothetical protein